MKIEEKRHFLDDGQQPTLPFVVEFIDGKRGEAISPLHLMDLIVHEYFSDCGDVQTFYILGTDYLRKFAASVLAVEGIRATVYDGLGPFYDNAVSRHPDEIEEEGELEFSNPEDPVILDSWDPWTVVASLIKTGYIKVYEKYPVWSDRQKKQGCEGCVFKQEKDGQPYCAVWESSGAIEVWHKVCPFVTNGEMYPDYVEVTPENLTDPSYKHGWVPISERKKEYIGLRYHPEEGDVS